MARHIIKTIRYSQDELIRGLNGYDASGYKSSFGQYCRDLITGEIPHPKFADAITPQDQISPFSDTGKLNGVDEMRNHYLSVIIAANIQRIKMDPEFKKYIKADSDTFLYLVDLIRGYKFDEETELKSPL